VGVLKRTMSMSVRDFIIGLEPQERQRSRI
jgi:hypothetical protein